MDAIDIKMRSKAGLSTITMSNRIEASFDTLLCQASLTAEEYFDKAILYLDSAFGEGFAKKHPEIVAKFASIAASDFNASVIACSGRCYKITQKCRLIPFKCEKQTPKWVRLIKKSGQNGHKNQKVNTWEQIVDIIGQINPLALDKDE